jgi:predicted alpha/beta superfamily hydrolase
VIRRIIALWCSVTLPPVSRVAGVQTQPGTPLEIGRSFTIPSLVLGESRVIDVTLPEGYDPESERRYPVVVVLDGEFEHEIAAAITRFYASMSQLPPMIVVGVRNTDRMRDLTPPPAPEFHLPPEAKAAGGADRFLSFLADELLPYLERAYHTVPMRVLVGHSLGGLFALYALGKQSQLFTGYLVMEPAVWWNNEREFREAKTALQQPVARRVRVMMVNTQPLGLDTTRWGGDQPMVRHFRTAGETHASMAAAGIMVGLRTIFSDYLPSGWRPGTRAIAMLDRYDSLAERLGYPVPIPEEAFAKVVRMSVHSRYFDDAEQVLTRMERTLGASDQSRSLRDMLARERVKPQPANFVPLEIPVRRPTPRESRAFLGRWKKIGERQAHEIEISASADTIVVHDRIQFPNGEWFEGDDPVIQVTPDGTLEWGLPFFRGIAALLVLRGRILENGSMEVVPQVRGWVPIGPGPDLTRIERFQHVTPVR